MESKVKRILRKAGSFFPILKGVAEVSFSEYGEDTIMLKMLQRHHVEKITYLDIGANDPVKGSNTYAFYQRGHYGVLVEPNKLLHDKIVQKRPADTCLNFGIGIGGLSEADYYRFEEQYCALNTFSKDDAEDYEKQGFKVQSVVKLPLRDINKVIAENFSGAAPTFISLDVEGLDEMILQELDYEKYKPLLICVETVQFNLDKEFIKRRNIFDFLESKGYFVYADTHINTIFCNRELYDGLLK